MADTLTSTSVNDNMIMAWFSKKIIARLEPETPLIEFAQKEALPLRAGKTATWNGWKSIGAASSALTEGTSNSLPALSSRKVTATIAGYGRGVVESDLFTMTAIFDAVNGAMETLQDSANKTVERVCQMGIFKNNINDNQLTHAGMSAMMSSPVSAFCAVTGTINGTTKQFQFPGVFGASTTRLSAVSKTAPSVSARLSLFSIRKTVTQLRKQNAKPFADGYFVGYTHPNATSVLMTDPSWQNWNQYQNSKATLYKHEVGQIHMVRFVQSTECPRYAAAAHSVNLTFIFGQGAFGLTTLDGSVKMYIAKGPDTNDPFAQLTKVTYKLYAAAAALNPSAGRILFTHEKL